LLCLSPFMLFPFSLPSSFILYPAGRVYRYSFESASSEFLTCSMTVWPGLIVLPDFLAIRIVVGLDSSLSVFFCLVPFKNNLAPESKFCPVTINLLPATVAPEITGAALGVSLCGTPSSAISNVAS
jgi:hypothetical protein